MTPHYANWTVGNPPGDWRSPNPVPFLTVASGVTMIVGVVPRGPANGSDLAIVMDWIARDGLPEVGRGALGGGGQKGGYRVAASRNDA